MLCIVGSSESRANFFREGELMHFVEIVLLDVRCAHQRERGGILLAAAAPQQPCPLPPPPPPPSPVLLYT